MKLPLLKEVFGRALEKAPFLGPGFGDNSLFRTFGWAGRKLTEADLDIDKFTRAGQPQGRAPLKPQPGGETGHPDIGEYMGSEKKPGKKATFTELVPQPREGMGAMSMDTAKKLGLKKVPNWFLNPVHWDRGHGGDDELDWEPGLSLKPKTPEAKKLVSQVHQSGIRPQHVLKKDVWDKYFKKDHGGQGD